MCWYSQHNISNSRKAIEGEDLIVRDFPNQGRWLASPGEPEIPVCLPNGCLLRISDIPKNLQKDLKVDSEAVAEFREIHEQAAGSLLARLFLPPRLCFDVVLFPNGRSIEISEFTFDMMVDVLSPSVVSGVGGVREEIERIPV